MPLNPLQGAFIPTDTALERQEFQDQGIAKPQDNLYDVPVNSTNSILLQQTNESLPTQNTQQTGLANYTDRESQGDNTDEEENAVEAMEEKTKKNVKTLQKGLDQIFGGVENLRWANQTDSSIVEALDEKKQNISNVAQKLLAQIEKTLKEAVSTMFNSGQNFFDTAVTELTALRTTLDEFVVDMSKRQGRIPTPEVRDHSTRASVLRQYKQDLGNLLIAITEAANQLLEQAEDGLRQLLAGNDLISTGFNDVSSGIADGFKSIETGFRLILASVATITDATLLFRAQLGPIFKKLDLFPTQLQTDLGSRAALGIPERIAAPLWQSAERSEQCWRTLQGHLGALSGEMGKFGDTIEASFEQAARTVMGDGKLTVECVNSDLGDLKANVEELLSSSAGKVVVQILEGVDQVETAIGGLVETSEQKHNTIKRGSTAKLPSHFNVRL
ncbi:MAG: hypothetical protein AB1489_01465 [Acidobacteriota bacterium]